MSRIAAELHITGLVQGVGYRHFCYREATRLNVTGWVKNINDGSVRALVEGEEADVDSLVEILNKGPFGAHVDHIEINRREPTDKYESFDILHY